MELFLGGRSPHTLSGMGLMKKFNELVTLLAVVAVAMICAAPVAILVTGCAKDNAAAKFGWTASLDGDGTAITGGSVSVKPAAVMPTPWPVPAVEQLEKGNERKVAAQVAARDEIAQGDVSAPDKVVLRYEDIVPTPVRAEPPIPYADTAQAKAWYNGFL